MIRHSIAPRGTPTDALRRAIAMTFIRAALRARGRELSLGEEQILAVYAEDAILAGEKEPRRAAMYALRAYGFTPRWVRRHGVRAIEIGGRPSLAAGSEVSPSGDG